MREKSQNCRRDTEQGAVDDELSAKWDPCSHSMRVPVTEEEQKLKDKQAHGPNSGSAPEKRQNLFSQQQFDLEQQKRAEKDG
jgi:hypothetical protein